MSKAHPLGAGVHAPQGSQPGSRGQRVTPVSAGSARPRGYRRGVEEPTPYEPMTLVRLGAMLAGSDDSRRWRLVAEFLEEYGWEPARERGSLLDQEPARTGDEQWDVFLAALAEHLAAKDGHAASAWAETRALRRFWFPFNTRAARVDQGQADA